MTAQTDALIEITGLKFSYNDLDVLKGLDLAVPRGKIVAILGASGCGKTTLLRLIGGQLRPAAGHVKVDGRIIHELDTDALYEMRRKMGMMFQQGGLFTDLSTFENIAFPMRERTDLPDELVHDMVLMKLHSVGLRGAWPLMPSELSGGMARRVALSRAIAMDPMLIMYDEPFSGLDPISLTQIGNLIRGLNDALGVTSIVVTYDVAESLKVVDYAYFISDGRVVARGTPEAIRTSSDPFVRQFVDGLADGPVAFHMPAKPLADELALSK
ncbi:MAG: putative phospholipid import ATP-binding protein MlaF [Rhodocyclaceae bacterium]|nr:MAG: ABC transporter ATP-binding protein [Rhodocyclaceae bacterium]MBE7421070.1 ABC transporter ATP-binding protein [Zoogloeaceae bacterium]MBV6408984.1 putative phospholipid import ATP-binding protein MlaF [Rhodocyclaceae bacterium]MCK6382900.1 ABC transporter ATP-binding protein [Rhodocyclaceae bacterium]CAG0930837.1 sulfate transport system ATP-binding protein [Rhodocyclaceae bacterium]